PPGSYPIKKKVLVGCVTGPTMKKGNVLAFATSSLSPVKLQPSTQGPIRGLPKRPPSALVVLTRGTPLLPPGEGPIRIWQLISLTSEAPLPANAAAAPV